MINFEKANFYQNDVLFDYIIKMLKNMHIWGSVWMYPGRHFVIIDFPSLGRKSDQEEGRILGINILKFKSLNFLNKNNLSLTLIKHTISKK
jgi:hypothetical protein